MSRIVTLAALLFVLFATDAQAGCFGAAAMDAACRAAPEPTQVTPTPAAAPRLPNSPCHALPSAGGPPVCAFGAPSGPTIALVGDSHAGHWRGALDGVAKAKGWRGLSITHSSCPLQKALRDLAEPRRTHCRRWKQLVFAWFARHPEVDTVFVAGLTGGSGVVPEAGHSAFATSQQGYRRAWETLPATVRRIVVIRDTPKFHGDTNACVQRAVDAHRPPGRTCALPRSDALDRDPAIEAAQRLRSPRVQTIDLTARFCDARRCYPVIGGALVARDNNHMTGVFSATLGPYLLDAVNALS